MIFIFLKYQISKEDGIILQLYLTLLEYYITLFNNGVRTGGGITDICIFYSVRYYSKYFPDVLFFI